VSTFKWASTNYQSSSPFPVRPPSQAKSALSALLPPTGSNLRLQTTALMLPHWDGHHCRRRHRVAVAAAAIAFASRKEL